MTLSVCVCVSSVWLWSLSLWVLVWRASAWREGVSMIEEPLASCRLSRELCLVGRPACGFCAQDVDVFIVTVLPCVLCVLQCECCRVCVLCVCVCREWSRVETCSAESLELILRLY